MDAAGTWAAGGFWSIKFSMILPRYITHVVNLATVSQHQYFKETNPFCQNWHPPFFITLQSSFGWGPQGLYTQLSFFLPQGSHFHGFCSLQGFSHPQLELPDSSLAVLSQTVKVTLWHWKNCRVLITMDTWRIRERTTITSVYIVKAIGYPYAHSNDTLQCMLYMIICLWCVTVFKHIPKHHWSNSPATVWFPRVFFRFFPEKWRFI